MAASGKLVGSCYLLWLIELGLYRLGLVDRLDDEKSEVNPRHDECCCCDDPPVKGVETRDFLHLIILPDSGDVCFHFLSLLLGCSSRGGSGSTRHAHGGLELPPEGIFLFPSAFEATYVPYY